MTTPPIPSVAAAPSHRAAWSRAARIAIAVILVASAVARLPKMNGPPLGPHDFRQTQTAITVQAWLEHGFSLLHYQTPVFGPPWEAPFEFPLYQASAFVIAKLGVGTDLACRLAVFVWLHVSALLLLVLGRRYAGEVATVAALAVYLLGPFAILWGHAVMIDYASVALALAYLLAVLDWAERPRAGVAVAGVAVGVLAAATKLTTVPVVVPGLLVAAYLALRRARREGSLARTVAVLAAMAVLPLLAAVLWTAWTDAVKAGAPATRWLMSKPLRGWMLGHPGQREDLTNWVAILSRLPKIVPGLFLVALALGIRQAVEGRGTRRVVAATALAGAVLPILIFFNLYWVHDYYLIAITPALALLFGIGIAELAEWGIGWRRPVLAAALVVAVLTVRVPYRYAKAAYRNNRKDPVALLSALVARVTPPDGWIVVEGDDWSPRIPYLANRRAFMILAPVPVELVADHAEVKTLVCAECKDELLARWSSPELVGKEAGFRVYRLGAPVVAGGARLDSTGKIP
jgi:4-amino-4-deoxy-L-arabinose transferase-like glycosyltransferase